MNTQQINEREWQLFCPICGAEPQTRCEAVAMHHERYDTARTMLDFEERHGLKPTNTPCDTYERNHEAAAEARAPVDHPE